MYGYLSELHRSPLVSDTGLLLWHILVTTRFLSFWKRPCDLLYAGGWLSHKKLAAYFSPILNSVSTPTPNASAILNMSVSFITFLPFNIEFNCCLVYPALSAIALCFRHFFTIIASTFGATISFNLSPPLYTATLFFAIFSFILYLQALPG